MYCPNCGEQVSDKAVVCTHCGVQVGDFVKSGTQNGAGAPMQQLNNVAHQAQENTYATVGFILSVFGAFLMLFGSGISSNKYYLVILIVFSVFALGVLIAGLVCSVRGLGVTKTGVGRKGLAISGVVISAFMFLWIIVQFVIVLLIL